MALFGQPIRQIAYAVDDVRAAARRHSEIYGSGPFLVKRTALMRATHRGRDAELQLEVAYGQWGAMQVEFMRQISPGPSVIRDLYPEGSGRTGLHHFACIVDDIELATAEFVSAGYSEAGRLYTGVGDIVFIDRTADEGCFIELYAVSPAVTAMYDTVARAAAGFDGRDPVVEWDIARWPLLVPTLG